MSAKAPDLARGAIEMAPTIARRLGQADRTGALRLASLLVALLMHGVLLYGLGRTAAESAGAGGTVLDAISVEVTLVPAAALESRTEASRTTATGTRQPVEAQEGALTDVNGTSSKQSDSSSEEDDREQQMQASAEAMATASQPQREEPANDRARREQPSPQPHSAPSSSSGGASASALASTPQPDSAAGAAAASPGIVRDYARRVAAALNRAKPKGTGLRGAVRLTFSVSAVGEIILVHVLRSSGRQHLDDAAVAAVRRTRLPRPPASLSEAQRRFEVPYEFR